MDTPNAQPTTEIVTPEAVNEAPVDQQIPVDAGLKADAKEAVIERMKTLKIKVDGREIEKKLDLMNEAELIKLAQLAEMSQKRAQEAADNRKLLDKHESQVQMFLEQLKSDPKTMLARLGVDLKGLSTKVMEEELEREMMSDEQRKIVELESKLKQIQEAEKIAKEQAETERKERIRAHYSQVFEADLKSALGKHGIKETPETRTRMINYMSKAINEKVKVTFDDIAPIVKEDMFGHIGDILGDLPYEALAKLLKPDQLKTLVSAQRKQTEKKVPPTANSITDSGKAVASSTKKQVNMKDFFNRI